MNGKGLEKPRAARPTKHTSRGAAHRSPGTSSPNDRQRFSPVSGRPGLIFGRT